MLALAAYAITGGEPLAIKPRRGAVTGTIGIVGLASVALGRPLLLLVAENVAKMNSAAQRWRPDWHSTPNPAHARTSITC